MLLETDQVDRELIAERVMGWTDISQTRENRESRCYRMLDGSIRIVNVYNWNPFAKVAVAIEVMEALPKEIIVTIRGPRAMWPGVECGYAISVFRNSTTPDGFVEVGLDFARTLTRAIVRLGRERPELFGGVK